jgi:Flp pilus assembly pilin Flp
MNALIQFVKNFWNDEEGATAVDFIANALTTAI